MLRGTVKWFSKDKGYGFITYTQDNEYTDYYFRIYSVIGLDAPNSRDLVDFRGESTKKGVAAKDVLIIEKASGNQPTHERPSLERIDERVECTHCGKRMVPRLQFKKGEPVARLCPFCMASQEVESWWPNAAILLTVLIVISLLFF